MILRNILYIIYNMYIIYIYIYIYFYTLYRYIWPATPKTARWEVWYQYIDIEGSPVQEPFSPSEVLRLLHEAMLFVLNPRWYRICPSINSMYFATFFCSLILTYPVGQAVWSKWTLGRVLAIMIIVIIVIITTLKEGAGELHAARFAYGPRETPSLIWNRQ